MGLRGYITVRVTCPSNQQSKHGLQTSEQTRTGSHTGAIPCQMGGEHRPGHALASRSLPATQTLPTGLQPVAAACCHTMIYLCRNMSSAHQPRTPTAHLQPEQHARLPRHGDALRGVLPCHEQVAHVQCQAHVGAVHLHACVCARQVKSALDWRQESVIQGLGKLSASPQSQQEASFAS